MALMNDKQTSRVRTGHGFFAALDQSGGSTPKALAEYGVPKTRYSTDEQMFDLVHAMRARIVTNAAFDSERVLAAILFEQTMDRPMEGMPTPDYLWEKRGVVPFLKVDKGLEAEKDGVQLMKPIGGLAELLARAREKNVYGTKMRSVIKDANQAGVEAIVAQQFTIGKQISDAGLVPILEPEVSIDSPHKAEAEQMLNDAIKKHLAALPKDAAPIIFKLTIPTKPSLYADLAADPRVLRLLALSGGYERKEACERLAKEPTMIASFSRALLEGLTDGQTDEQFTRTLKESIDEIYEASVNKKG
jgi:fructose-bisphosphate aldolase class I